MTVRDRSEAELADELARRLERYDIKVVFPAAEYVVRHGTSGRVELVVRADAYTIGAILDGRMNVDAALDAGRLSLSGDLTAVVATRRLSSSQRSRIR